MSLAARGAQVRPRSQPLRAFVEPRGARIRRRRPKPTRAERDGSRSANPLEVAGRFSESPVANSAAVLDLTQEMASVKAMVNDLMKQTRQTQAPHVPEDLFDFYTQLIQSQVADELAYGDFDDAPNAAPAGSASQRRTWYAKSLPTNWKKCCPSAGPIVRKKMTGTSCRRADRPDRCRKDDHHRQAGRQLKAPRETPRRADHPRHLSDRRRRSAQANMPTSSARRCES